MLLAFGALIAAGVPVLLALTSVAATMGIAAPLSHLIHAEPTVTSMIVLIGMAVGVDYSLFYLKREREERAAGHSTLDAVEIAAATSGHSILVSGAAVIASMAGLFIVGGATFNSLASGAIVVVAVAVIGSVTVLPALLAKLGRWVGPSAGPAAVAGQPADRTGRHQPPHPGSRRTTPGRAPWSSRSPPWSPSRPRRSGMKIHDANLDTLPASIPQVQTWHADRRRVPDRGHHRDRRRARHGHPARPGRRGAAPAGDVGRRDAAGSTRPGTDAIETAPDGETVRLTLPIPYSASDDRSGEAVQQLRDHLVPDALGGMHGRARRRR